MPLLRSYMGLVRHDGNSQLFRAAELSILSTRVGWPLHLHAEGVRGTGKTTIFRAVKDILPRIRRIKGCPYNCHPRRPHCPVHRSASRRERKALGTEWVTMPFVEISHSAKLGTVVGTIDLARITSADSPEAVLLPGTLARAHRGIVFVDEINRLADTTPELADVLLDVMGTRPGRLQIEESGLQPVEFILQASVWAASNPDEEPGPLEDVRRQLSDRFDLTIGVSRPSSRAEVKKILEASAVHGFGSGKGWRGRTGGPDAGRGRSSPSGRRRGGHARRERAPGNEKKARHVKMALLHRLRRPVPAMGEAEREVLASMYIRFDLESLRAVEAWQWAARVAAHRAGHPRVRRQDLLDVAGLVLAHRLDPRTLAELLTELEEEFRVGGESMAGAAGLEQDGPDAGQGSRHSAGTRPDYGPGPFGEVPPGAGTGSSVDRRHGGGAGERRYRRGAGTGGGAGGGARAAGENAGGRIRAEGGGSARSFMGRLRRWLSGDSAEGAYGTGAGRGSGGGGARGGEGSGGAGPQGGQPGRVSHRGGVVPPPPNKARALGTLDGEQVFLRLVAGHGTGPEGRGGPGSGAGTGAGGRTGGPGTARGGDHGAGGPR